MSVEDTVLGLWRALSARDWYAVKSYLADDCVYVDMPMPMFSARGPEDIVTRLKIGLESLSSYENHDGLLVSNGSDVIYEHSEVWRWHTGETVRLRFVTVHRVVGDKVALWKDYWDLGTLTSQAPSTFMESWASVDDSWVFDATGLI